MLKLILANGTARMNGTRMRDEGVAGRVEVPGVGCRRGRMENRVRRRVRFKASGRVKRSSRAREGREGRRERRGERVWRMSGVS